MSKNKGTGKGPMFGLLLDRKSKVLTPKRALIIFGCFLVVFKLKNQFTSTQLRYPISLSSYSLPCEMPVLDPFDPVQMKNVRKVVPIKCLEKHSPVYVDNTNVLQFNQTALGALKLKLHTIKCICQKIIRAKNSDSVVTLSKEFTCTPPYIVPTDFFRTRCLSNKFVIVDSLLTKINRTSTKFGVLNNNFYNVILFGIDSVSRNDAYRQIPRVVKYLKEELSGIEMSMYNRIGGHSFDNIIPLTTGHFANSVDLPYFGDVGVRFEKFPFIWKNLSENGYASFYAEDVLGFNTFNFQIEGFSSQPTTHYMRPFWQADFDLRPSTLFWKESVTSYNKRRCLVNKPKYLVQIEYLKQFISTYGDVRKFAMSHINDLAHQDVNELHQAEDHFLDFFKWLKSSGHLKNTFLFVYSDHGPRGQSSTHQSVMETNLPFFSIIPPDKVTKRYPELVANIRRNAQVLTTHFDTYATLRDVVLRNYEKPTVFYVSNKQRGISLFKNIGIQRSCQEANIPEEFCSCYRSKLLNITDDPLIQNIGNSVVNKLNSLLSTSDKCAVLFMKNIIEVRVLVQEKQTEEGNVVNEDDYSDYKITIETTPGNGQFLATSKVDSNGDRYILDHIERLNRYNNQSHCITEDKLRPLCLCKDMLK